MKTKEQKPEIMNPSDNPEWLPVEILPRTPNTAATNLHHRHGAGFACVACEILTLRRELDEALK